MDQNIGIDRKYKKSIIPNRLLSQLPINAPIKPKTILVKHPLLPEPANLAPIDPHTKAMRRRMKNFISVIFAVPKIPCLGILHFIRKPSQNKVKIPIFPLRMLF